MSIITNPSPLPAGAPELHPPLPAPAAPKRPKPWKLLLALVLAAAGVWTAYRLLNKPEQVQKGGAVTAIRTAKLTVGTLERVVRLAGETSARNFASITVPVMRGPDSRRDMVLIQLAKAGSFVRKGEQIAQIDAQAQQDHIDYVKSTIMQAEADIKKQRAQQAIDWDNLQQTLRVAKAELDQAKLDAQAAEVRTTIDQELLKLTVEEADARYKQLQADLATTQAIQKAELRILEITRDRHMLHRQRHENDIKRFTFRAPMDGLAVMQTFFRGGEMAQVEVGDEVHSGQSFMKIVDPSSMQVEASINQSESTEFRVGQPARVTLDAFAGLRFGGKVYSVGAMGVRGWRENYYIRNVPVRITIEGSDPRLIPDLSAAADVVVGRKDNVLVVPLEAVQSENGKNVVYVTKGNRFVPKEVELGLRNETQAAVLSGLEPGDTIALGQIPASSASLR